jgi:2-polyprenyl-3-methyl-5-hydroxy-6-metoxy-1,4-benzoquinol methylase
MTTAAELVPHPGPRPTASYHLDLLPETETTRWDELTAPYESREVFHSQAWLNYLAESRGLTIRRWAIRSGGSAVGYFCGGLLRMGPFRILGSPLKSWATNVMGPLIDRDVDQRVFLEAVDGLARRERLSMIELEHPILGDAVLEAADFIPDRRTTYAVKLTPTDPDPMWRALDSTCRNRIRKALSCGVTVEDTDDPDVADEYYDLYLQLMRRKHVAPPFSRRYARLLFSHLKPADRLFALRVKDSAGRLLSVGLFPHDDRAVFFWSGASREDAHALCPNDLLHWRAMCLAAERGLLRYDMSGPGRFKRKFGGVLTTVTRWHKCYSGPARLGRTTYESWFRLKTRLREGGLSNGQPPRAGSGHLDVAAAPKWMGPWPRPLIRSRIIRLSDLWRAPLHDFPIRDAVIDQYLPLTSEMRVLEVGPGSGITAFRLAPALKHLSLLDIAQGNIEHLQAVLGASPNLSFVCTDVCQQGLANSILDRFDAIYALEVFEFVAEPEACLRNLAALLKPGGHLLLLFPNYPRSSSPGPTHFPRRADLDRALREAGFSTWATYALRLRPFAATLYQELHERPIRLYRRLRERGDRAKPLVYDDTWAFRHGRRLGLLKYPLNAVWLALAGAMGLGGDVFEHMVLNQDDILNRNLLVLARR